MSTILENKVSNLIAQVKRLESELRTCNKTIEEQTAEKTSLQDHIKELEKQTRSYRDELVDLKNVKEDLTMQLVQNSKVSMLDSQLRLTVAENIEQKSKIMQQEAEL